jgi:hypothetical protein
MQKISFPAAAHSPLKQYNMLKNLSFPAFLFFSILPYANHYTIFNRHYQTFLQDFSEKSLQNIFYFRMGCLSKRP